jgi:hypothetical protein
MNATRAAAAAALLGFALLASGCTADDPVVGPEPTSTPSASASATPDPTPTPQPVARDCLTVLPEERQAMIADQQATLGYEFSAGFAEKMRDTGRPEALIDDWGGVLCQFGEPNSDNVANYGWAQVTDDQAGALRTRLLGEGYASSAVPQGEQLLFVDDDFGIEYRWVIAADDIFMATAEIVLAEMMATIL